MAIRDLAGDHYPQTTLASREHPLYCLKSFCIFFFDTPAKCSNYEKCQGFPVFQCNMNFAAVVAAAKGARWFGLSLWPNSGKTVNAPPVPRPTGYAFSLIVGSKQHTLKFTLIGRLLQEAVTPSSLPAVVNHQLQSERNA